MPAPSMLSIEISVETMEDELERENEIINSSYNSFRREIWIQNREDRRDMRKNVFIERVKREVRDTEEREDERKNRSLNSRHSILWNLMGPQDFKN